MMLSDLLGGNGNVGWAQECARTVVIFAYGLVAFRLAGRRIFSRWSALDIVVSIVVGSNLSRALTGHAPLFGTLVATTLMLLLHALAARAAARWPIVSRWVEGLPVRITEDGRANPDGLRRHQVSAVDLQEALRAAGLESVAAAKAVVLEPSGKLTVLK